MSLKVHGNALPEGYRLHWYRIGRVLGQGGFGITYLATDTNLHKQVAIKEYLPLEFVVREGDSRVRPFTEDRKQLFQWGLERFLQEARTLAKFIHPNIVRVFAVFEANDTAYMVMEYEQGSSFQDLIKFDRIDGESSLLRVVHALLDGVEHMHEAGFIHRDIKPGNIYVRADGSPVLLDFGSARMALGVATRTLTSMVSPGFAPYEQYHSEEGKQGPWTDIYGLGATLYAALDRGKGPLDAIVRGNARIENKPDPLVAANVIGQGRYSAALLNAIDAALAFAPENRPQSVAEWRGMFPSPDAIPEAPEAPTEVRPGRSAAAGAQAKTRFNPLRIAALGSVVLALLAGGGWYLMQQREQTAAQQEEAARTARAEQIARAARERAAADQARREAGKREAAAEAARQAEAEARAAAQAKARAEEEAGAQAQAEASARAAGDAKRQEITRLLGEGQKAIQALRLSTPAGDNALEHFRAVLTLEPENEDARRGIRDIVNRYVALAGAKAATGDFDQAGRYLDNAEAIAPGAETIRVARDQLASLAAKTAGATQAAVESGERVTSAQPRPAAGAEIQAIADTLADGTRGPDMIRIPAGRFLMGSPAEEAGRDVTEGPQLAVAIPADFALGKFEVTVGEFRRFVEATGYRTQAEKVGGCFSGQGKQEGATWRDPGFRRPPGDRHPVVCVSWKDAVAYADWLSAQTGARYRLPSEAEWEYAARANTTTSRFWGDDPGAACRFANVGDLERTSRGGTVSGTALRCSDGFGGPAPVGKFQANAFGLHDLLGNVWEWTADCWREAYADAGAGDASASGEGCTHHSRRGGNFASGAEEVRSAARKKGRPPAVAVGFRLARDL
jgi:formylglycine-generating enzyme required for sulfatase activity